MFVNLDSVFGKFDEVCTLTLMKGVYLDVDVDVSIPSDHGEYITLLDRLYQKSRSLSNSCNIMSFGFTVYYTNDDIAEGIRMSFRIDDDDFKDGKRIDYNEVHECMLRAWKQIDCTNMFEITGKEFDEIAEVIGEKKWEDAYGHKYHKLRVKFGADMNDEAFSHLYCKAYVERITEHEYWISDMCYEQLKSDWYKYM